jgi:dipeptidyl aminopeptidase/acylaminoacyl peptidase
VKDEAGAVAHPSGEWPLAGGAALVLEQRVLEVRGSSGAVPVAEGVVGRAAVSADGARFVFVRESAGELRTEVLAVELRDGAWSAPRLLADEGTPDLVSISPDGRRVAFVAGAGGIASVFVVPFEGGPPVQLTNLGLVADGRGRPAGFVPIPYRDPPRFEGGHLIWTSRQGEHRAVLP